MKIVSWNVNGVRAIMKKGFDESLEDIGADVICLQETKAQVSQVKEVVFGLGYDFVYANEAEKKGYSGTAILSKKEPLSIQYDMGIEEHDKEGRVICAEFESFFLITVYTPNSGSALKRLDYRKQWDIDFHEYLKKLEEQKPIVVCGDFNVAHTEIDLARPKPNYNKSAGFMQQEIDGMDRYTQNGFKDTFRYFYPDKTDVYTWWSYRAGARQKNVGWRIDYFLASESFMDSIKDAVILNEYWGSDHCPVAVELK